MALQGVATLETLVGRLVLGRDPHFDDPYWKPWQREVWRLAVGLWIEQRKAARFGATMPTVIQVWEQVEVIVGGQKRRATHQKWWTIQRSWPTVAKALGIGDRRAAYWLADVQGWKFGGGSGSRKITHAPCVKCEVSTPSKEIRARMCEFCRS